MQKKKAHLVCDVFARPFHAHIQIHVLFSLEGRHWGWRKMTENTVVTKRETTRFKDVDALNTWRFGGLRKPKSANIQKKWLGKKAA